MNCPSCGRALAAGPRTCVYCAHGNTYQRKEQLKVPEGSTGYRKRTPWGRWVLVALVVAGVAAWFSPARVHILALIDKIKSLF